VQYRIKRYLDVKLSYALITAKMEAAKLPNSQKQKTVISSLPGLPNLDWVS
jgi:hypothetical protein